MRNILLAATLAVVVSAVLATSLQYSMQAAEGAHGGNATDEPKSTAARLNAIAKVLAETDGRLQSVLAGTPAPATDPAIRDALQNIKANAELIDVHVDPYLT